jgi:hypothetical protein
MLRDDLNEALKSAMRERDQHATTTLRTVLAAIKQADIDARPRTGAEGLPEADVIGLLRKLVKQRRESIELYQRGGRADLVAKEEAEILLIERLLPRHMDPAAVEAAIDTAIAETGAATIKDMGKVMAHLRARHAGDLEFGAVGGRVKAKLGG